MEYSISFKQAERPVSDIIESYDLIQLEETEEAFFRSARRVFFTEGKIIMLTNDSRILTFSDSGEFIGSIDKKGRGPEEYLSLRDICYDKAGKKIIGSCSTEVLWFNTDGDIMNPSASRRRAGLGILVTREPTGSEGGDGASLANGRFAW